MNARSPSLDTRADRHRAERELAGIQPVCIEKSAFHCTRWSCARSTEKYWNQCLTGYFGSSRRTSAHTWKPCLPMGFWPVCRV